MKEKDFLKKTIEKNEKTLADPTAKATRNYRDFKNNNQISSYRRERANLRDVLNAEPGTLTLLSKATAKEGVRDTEDTKQIVEGNSELLRGHFNRVSCKRERNKKTIELLPDLDTAGDIIITSTLSPNRLTQVDLNYSIDDKDDLGNAQIKSEMMSFVSSYIDENYDLTDSLPDILKESLIISGADPHLIISESTVDDIVNADIVREMSLESFKSTIDANYLKLTKPLSILDGIDKFNKTKLPAIKKDNLNESKKVYSTESALVDYLISANNIKASDNVDVMKVNSKVKKVRSDIIRETIHSGIGLDMESKDKINYLDIFRERSSSEYTPVVDIHKPEESTRKAIGKPMVMRIPTEAVCPVIIPGNKNEHIGYFILLDERGIPVNSRTSRSGFDDLSSRKGNRSFAPSPIDDVYREIGGTEGGCVDSEKMYELFSNKMEDKLYNLFVDSIYGEDVTISNSTLIMQTLFSRALSQQKTTVLFATSESLSYFGFLFDDYGVGKSLLDDLAILTSMRSILLFARVTAQLRNSIDITEVGIQLDPNITDAEGVIERIKADTLKLRRNTFPLGETDPTMLLDWIDRAGLKFRTTGHPDIPDMTIDFQKANLQYSPPDEGIDEEMAEKIFGKLGVPSELISKAYSPEFAVEVVKGSALYIKRIIRYQKLVNPEITKFVRTLMYNDEDLKDELRKIIRKNKGDVQDVLDIEQKSQENIDPTLAEDKMIRKIISSIKVELPKVYSGESSDIDKEFGDQIERLTKAVEEILHDDMFRDLGVKELETKVPFIRRSIIIMLTRKWAADNNYLPELFGMFGENGEDLETIKDNTEMHYSSIYAMAISMLKGLDQSKPAEDDVKLLSDKSNEDEPGGGSDDGGSVW